MTSGSLFAIDLAAEVATLCESQLQGSWQVPAELVRLASARGASRVEIRRVRGGLELACDAVAASRDELAAVTAALDGGLPPGPRQQAIADLEAGGAIALLWAVGTAGAAFELRCRTRSEGWGMEARKGKVRVMEADHDLRGAPGSRMRWRGGRRTAGRAVGWLETALRFLPIPATLDGRPMARGFPDALYRMRVAEPLPAELEVTASGDMPALWLLQHGVLSARAVVPGSVAFSAAVEMSGVARAGDSPAALRSAVNPYLPALVDRAVTMLLQLAGRLPDVGEPVRRRVAELLLRAAELGLQRRAVLDLPMVPLRAAGRRRLVSPAELAGLAAGRGDVLPAADPGARAAATCRGPIVEAGADERRLLAGLLGLGFEQTRAGRDHRHLVRRLVEASRRGLSRAHGLIRGRAVAHLELDAVERQLVEAAERSGLVLALARDAGRLRRRGRRLVLGREAAVTSDAARAVAADDAWLYPALLAAGADPDEIPEAVRARWLDRRFPMASDLEVAADVS